MIDCTGDLYLHTANLLSWCKTILEKVNLNNTITQLDYIPLSCLTVREDNKGFIVGGWVEKKRKNVKQSITDKIVIVNKIIENKLNFFFIVENVCFLSCSSNACVSSKDVTVLDCIIGRSKSLNGSSEILDNWEDCLGIWSLEKHVENCSKFDLTYLVNFVFYHFHHPKKDLDTIPMILAQRPMCVWYIVYILITNLCNS